jgi:FkbM family methyltransferase
MTFIEIGAHVGYFSVLAGKIVGPEGLVFAFDPDERNFALLLANVSRHGLANVVCSPWAVTDRAGFVELHISGNNTGDHRVYASTRRGRRGASARSIALDSLGVVRPPVDLVKLDVQGAEDAAVRGMEALLAASPKVVLSVEFWPYGMQLFGGDPRRVLDYYRSLGFAVRVQDPDEAGTRAMTDDDILEACREKDGWAFVTLLLERG